jgi:hypothetical protein
VIFHNFWLKVFSIASGTIIWMAIHFSIDHDLSLSEPAASRRLVRKTVTVPISALQDEADKREFKLTPSNAVLTVMSEGKTLSLEGNEIKMFVDLTDHPATNPTQEDLHPGVPTNIYVLEFKPHTVTVEPAGP